MAAVRQSLRHLRSLYCVQSRHQLVRGSLCGAVSVNQSNCSRSLHSLVGASTSTPCSIASLRRSDNRPRAVVRGYHKGQSLQTGGQREGQDSSEEQQNAEEGEKEAEETLDEDEEERILAASLAFVPQHGWTTEAIAEGARSLGLSGTVHGIFPGGGYDIISFFEHQCNEKLTSHLKQLSESQQQEESNLPAGMIVREALEYRLRMLVPFIRQWPQALGTKAHPLHVADSLETLAFMLDDIWYYAGDRSTDMNWYTKRGLLSCVYCSTELFMVQDSSDDFTDTWSFMDRRLADVRDAGHLTQQLAEYGQVAVSMAGGIFKTAINTLGWKSTTR